MNNLLIPLGLLGAVATGYWFGIHDEFEPNSLKGKNVLITGASMGIGEQMAYHYARMGARVMITARSEDRLKKVVTQCREVGDKDGLYIYFVADMSIMNQTGQVIQAAVKNLGGIDILVLNHIVAIKAETWLGTAEDMSRMDQIMRVNFFSYVHLASHALSELQRTKGSIVVLSSIAGRSSMAVFLSYSSSKFALDGFFTGLREGLRDRGISLTMCYLGVTDTDSTMGTLSPFRVLSYMPVATAKDVAFDIVRGGALHQNEIYSPYWVVKSFVIILNIAPNFVQSVTSYLFSAS